MERIQVIARIRPLTRNEIERNDEIITTTSENTIYLEPSTSTGISYKSYKLDGVLDSNDSQSKMFEKVEPLLSALFEGYNCSLFTYGQTGTGKTYTMLGYDFWTMANEDMIQFSASRITSELRHSMGIVPRTMIWIFQKIATMRSASVNVNVSYVEIYNEKLIDLLNPNPDLYDISETPRRDGGTTTRVNNLDIRETKKGEIVVAGLTQIQVRQIEEVMEILWSGARARSIAATDMNEHSSRSHTIFQVYLEIRSSHSTPKDGAKRAKLCLVDLAGSEKWKGHQVATFSQDRIKEFTSINKSLSALGNCISALLNPSRGHVPYRDSKLTRLLQDSLGGNTRTLFIVTLSPSSEYIEETVSTLQFADRAMKVRIQTTVNKDELNLSKKMLMEKYNEDIGKLKKIITVLMWKLGSKSSNGFGDDGMSEQDNPDVNLEDILESMTDMTIGSNSSLSNTGNSKERTKSSSSVSGAGSSGPITSRLSTSRSNSPVRSRSTNRPMPSSISNQKSINNIANYDYNGRNISRGRGMRTPSAHSTLGSMKLRKDPSTTEHIDMDQYIHQSDEADQQSLILDHIYQDRYDHEGFTVENPSKLGPTSNYGHSIASSQLHLINPFKSTSQSSNTHGMDAYVESPRKQSSIHSSSPTSESKQYDQSQSIRITESMWDDVQCKLNSYEKKILTLEQTIEQLHYQQSQLKYDYETMCSSVLKSNEELSNVLVTTQRDLAQFVKMKAQSQGNPSVITSLENLVVSKDSQSVSHGNSKVIATSGDSSVMAINIQDVYHRMQSIETMVLELRDNMSRAYDSGATSPYFNQSLQSSGKLGDHDDSEFDRLSSVGSGRRSPLESQYEDPQADIIDLSSSSQRARRRNFNQSFQVTSSGNSTTADSILKLTNDIESTKDLKAHQITPNDTDVGRTGNRSHSHIAPADKDVKKVANRENVIIHTASAYAFRSPSKRIDDEGQALIQHSSRINEAIDQYHQTSLKSPDNRYKISGSSHDQNEHKMASINHHDHIDSLNHPSHKDNGQPFNAEAKLNNFASITSINLSSMNKPSIVSATMSDQRWRSKSNQTKELTNDKIDHFLTPSESTNLQMEHVILGMNGSIPPNRSLSPRPTGIPRRVSVNAAPSGQRKSEPTSPASDIPSTTIQQQMKSNSVESGQIRTNNVRESLTGRDDVYESEEIATSNTVHENINALSNLRQQPKSMVSSKGDQDPTESMKVIEEEKKEITSKISTQEDEERKAQEARRRARSFLDLMGNRPIKDLGMIQKHDDRVVTLIPLPESYTDATNPVQSTKQDENSASLETEIQLKTKKKEKNDKQKPRPVWRSYLDKQSGHIYYHNKITGVTTWEQPSQEELQLKHIDGEIIQSDDPRYL